MFRFICDCIYGHMFVCMYRIGVCMYIYMYVYICLYIACMMFTYSCIYVCMYVCITGKRWYPGGDGTGGTILHLGGTFLPPHSDMQLSVRIIAGYEGYNCTYLPPSEL